MNQIFSNGKIEYIKENTSLEEYLQARRAVLPRVFVVELNMKIIKKEYWAINYLKTGDRLEIVQFSGGG